MQDDAASILRADQAREAAAHLAAVIRNCIPPEQRCANCDGWGFTQAGPCGDCKGSGWNESKGDLVAPTIPGG
jgi:DnaJ-class molecular chaperone